jgi:hypothetical protein
VFRYSSASAHFSSCSTGMSLSLKHTGCQRVIQSQTYVLWSLPMFECATCIGIFVCICVYGNLNQQKCTIVIAAQMVILSPFVEVVQPVQANLEWKTQKTTIKTTSWTIYSSSIQCKKKGKQQLANVVCRHPLNLPPRISTVSGTQQEVVDDFSICLANEEVAVVSPQNSDVSCFVLDN